MQFPLFSPLAPTAPSFVCIKYIWEGGEVVEEQGHIQLREETEKIIIAFLIMDKIAKKTSKIIPEISTKRVDGA